MAEIREQLGYLYMQKGQFKGHYATCPFCGKNNLTVFDKNDVTKPFPENGTACHHAEGVQYEKGRAGTVRFTFRNPGRNLKDFPG